MLRYIVSHKLTDATEVLTASITRTIFALMLEPVTTSETSVNFNQSTRRNILYNNHLHIGRRDNLKYQ